MANETAKATIYLEGKQAEATLDSLSRRGKQLKKDFKDAQAAGDQIKMTKLEKEIRAVDSALASVRKESFDTQKVLRNLNGSSFNDLTKALKQSQRELKRMGQTDPGYKDKLRDVVTLKTKVSELSGQQAVQTSLWGKMANGANKYFNIMMAGIAILTGVVFSVSQLIKGMLGLSDALADVEKTTGLARKEVREMYQDFRNLNTRTPRAELLALAEEAGRLGITGKKNIMDFVEVANKIKISLGDDLGGNAEEAIRDVGKLTQIFRVANQYNTDYKTSLEKVGSGLNQVANNSNASAGYLVEYMKRLGGIAVQSKITAANIMGYASTFDQLGKNVEMAATAQSKIIVDMFTDPANYARIAGMEVGNFSKLLKTDANEAFIKFLEGLNGNNEGLSEMASKLDNLGVDGSRAIDALSALSSNTKMVREQQTLANDAMQKGTSLQTEYAIKNENLAGSWAKLTAFIHSKFINSGFLVFLEKIIGKTAEMIEQPVEAKLQKEQQELNILVGAITNANTTQQNRNDLIKEIQEKYPDFLKNIDTEKITNEQLKTRLEEVNKQYEDRILLMIKEDMLSKNYKERTELKLKELDMLKQLAAYEITAAEARAKMTPGMDANSYRTLLSQKEVDALQSIPLVTAKLEENRKRVDELKKSEQDLNDALGQLRQNKPESPPPNPGAGGGNKIPLTPEEIKAAAEAAKKATQQAITAIEAANITEMSVIKKRHLDGITSEEQYNSELLAQELKFLTNKMSNYKKGSKEYEEAYMQSLDLQLKAQEEIDKKTEDEKKKSLKKELDDLENQQKNELALLKKDALSKGFSDEETNALLIAKKIEFLNRKLILEQKYGQDTVETTAAITVKINELAENAVKGDEDRAKELADIRKKYLDEEVLAKEEKVNDLARIDKLYQSKAISSYEEYQRLKTAINKKYEERRLQKAIEFGQKAQEFVSVGSNLVQSLMDAELAKTGDNEEKKAAIKKKYANAQFLMAASEIVVNTAVAIMQGFAQLGPIGGAIAAVLLGATGIAQLAIANAERQKMQGYSEGGHTGSGDKREVAGVVHRKEYVIPEEGTSAPGVRPFIDLIEIARKNGSLARLDLRPVVQYISSGRRELLSGGFSSTTATNSTQPYTSANTGIQISMAQFSKFNSLLEKLDSWEPSIAVETYERKRKNYEKYNDGGLK